MSSGTTVSTAAPSATPRTNGPMASRALTDASPLAAPRRPAFLEAIIDYDEARQRIGPPPTEEGVQDQADEYGGGESGVDKGHVRLGREHRVVQLPPRDPLALREQEHGEERGRQPADAAHARRRVFPRKEDIGRLPQDVEGQGEEGTADEPQRLSLAVLVHAGELPDHDHRSEDLDER